MDCQMPVMDGYDATREIRKLENDDNHIPIIALTANTQESDKQKCFESGMDDFISKPFNKNQLALMIDKWF